VEDVVSEGLRARERRRFGSGHAEAGRRADPQVVALDLEHRGGAGAQQGQRRFADALEQRLLGGAPF
jgi:hypothetical protein